MICGYLLPSRNEEGDPNDWSEDSADALANGRRLTTAGRLGKVQRHCLGDRMVPTSSIRAYRLGTPLGDDGSSIPIPTDLSSCKWSTAPMTGATS